MSDSDIKTVDSRLKRLTKPFVFFLAKPWLDKFVLKVSEKFFFPSSYLWSLLNKSEYDYEKFKELIDGNCECDISEKKMLKIMSKIKRRSIRYELAKENWHKYFFESTSDVDNECLKIINHNRLETSNSFFQSRFKLSFAARNINLKTIKMSTKTEDQVKKVYEESINDEAFFKEEEDNESSVQVSKKVEYSNYIQFWIKFKSPYTRVNDWAYARVTEPKGVKNPPTIVFGHGIFVEFDHWKNLVDETDEFVQNGIRVVRPESPWHGRRIKDGNFGGFDFFNRAPLSYIDFFSAVVKEWFVISKWAKETSSGKLGFGGSSLGAQSAQLVALKSAKWPKIYRPEALLLLTHCSHLSRSAEPLLKMWNVNERLLSKDWHKANLQYWAGLIEPIGDLPVKKENVISVLGNKDEITPFEDGVDLLDSWKIPFENRFYWNMGHFGVPLMLQKDNRPIQLLIERLK